jgi:hypothetical protein
MFFFFFFFFFFSSSVKERKRENPVESASRCARTLKQKFVGRDDEVLRQALRRLFLLCFRVLLAHLELLLLQTDSVSRLSFSLSLSLSLSLSFFLYQWQFPTERKEKKTEKKEEERREKKKTHVLCWLGWLKEGKQFT